jgi:hypothetical protein
MDDRNRMKEISMEERRAENEQNHSTERTSQRFVAQALSAALIGSRRW